MRMEITIKIDFDESTVTDPETLMVYIGRRIHTAVIEGSETIEEVELSAKWVNPTLTIINESQ